MRTFCQLFVMSFVLAALSISLSAQSQQAPDASALAEAVSRHAAEQDADRAAIREALGRPEVATVAKSAGIDLDRASDSVNTLSGETLARAGAFARQVNDTLVGGDSTFIISSTGLIILLLLILLLVVALK